MYGLDFLGLPKYADLVRREHPQGWALGAFARTFGDALPHIGRILATGRVPHLRVQLLWSDSHTFGDRDIPAITKEARRYQKLKQDFPGVVFELSPFCEHNLQSPDKYLEIVKNEAPDCIPVNTPWRGAFSKKFKNEIHGQHAKPKGDYNFSFDGTPCVDSDVEKFKAGQSDADVFFFWTSQFNGRKNPADPTPRPDRKAWPTSDLIDSVIYLHRDCGAVKLPARWLWKSHADQHSVPPEPRALKPVFIIPPKARRVELIADNEQLIASSSPPQPFSDGRWRYYFGQFGYQIAERARRIQGHPVCTVVIDGKKRGTVNPAFRCGSFR